MKKLLSITIILTLLVGLFSACNQNTDTCTDNQSNTQTDTQTDTMGTQDNTGVTPEVKKEEYYKSYRLMSRDLKKGTSDNTARHMDSYETLKMYLDPGVLDSFDKSIFNDNIVFIAFLESDGAIGFKGFNGKKIECDSLNYIYDKYEEIEKLEPEPVGPSLDYNYLVLIPKSESTFLYNEANTSISVEINTMGDYSVKTYTDINLGSESYVRVLKTKAEYDAYIKETGLKSVPIFAQNKMIVAHYEASYALNRYAISYERGDLENKTLELCATGYYENDMCTESIAGALSLIFVPYNELAQDPEFKIVISEKKHINTVQAVKNKSYFDYYKTIDILYNSECNEFAYLPTDYGTYFWLAQTSSELKALYGYEAYESFIKEYNVLVIYRHSKTDTTTASGFHSFKIEDGKMQITVNEYENNLSNGSEHDQRMLAFVCIPKSEFQSYEKPTKLELKSNMLEYYTSSIVSASYATTKKSLILNITYGEFVNDWNEEKIPQISSSTFEKYYLLAIKSKNDCTCCHYQTGYYSFYAPENDAMQISLDIVYEYGTLCDLWENDAYDFILIPKEEFPPLYTFNYESIKVHENKINTNYKRLYGAVKEPEEQPDKIEIEYENPKYYKEFSSSYTVVADGVVYEEDQIFLDGIFEPSKKSQYIALTSKADLEAFTLLNHEKIEESIFNNNYIVAILHYTLGPSFGGPTLAGFYDGFFNKTSAEIKMDTYYHYYNATEDERDVYRLYFVAVPKQSVSTVNEVHDLSIEQIELEQYDMAKYSNVDYKTEETQAYFLADSDALNSYEMLDGIIPHVSYPLIMVHLSEPIYAEYIVNSFCYTGERIYIKFQLLSPRVLNDAHDWDNMIFVSLLPHRQNTSIELTEDITALESCQIYVIFETMTSMN